MPPWTSERMSWRSQLEEISAAPSATGTRQLPPHFGQKVQAVMALQPQSKHWTISSPSSPGFVVESFEGLLFDTDSFEGLLFDADFGDVEHVGEGIVRVIDGAIEEGVVQVVDGAVDEDVVEALRWPDTSSDGAVNEVVIRVVGGDNDLGGVAGVGREIRPRSSLSPAGTSLGTVTGDGRIGN